MLLVDSTHFCFSTQGAFQVGLTFGICKSEHGENVHFSMNYLSWTFLENLSHLGIDFILAYVNF